MDQYKKALKFVLANGQERLDRTGVGTLSCFGYQMRFDLKTTFPAVTTKKLAWKAVLSELLWFIEGSGDENRLKEILYGKKEESQSTIWSGNAQADYWKPKAKFEGDLGRVYGVNWRGWIGTSYIKPVTFKKENIVFSGEKIYGVGEYGKLSGISKKTINLLKPVWENMLAKCYDEKNESYHLYGGKGFHVSSEWLVFKNFIKDFKKIQRWEMKLEYPSEYDLDCKICGSNRFSLYSSMWSSKEEIELNSIPQFYKDKTTGERLLVIRKKIDQLKGLIAGIKHDPFGRRHILTAWNVAELDQMALPPCHTFAQFYVGKNGLSCQLYQRSADMFLGVPFNIASYALLTNIIAQVCELKADELVHTFGDAHIYLNHIEQVKQQLKRKTYPLPKLKINKNIKDIDGFKMEDFELIDYKFHPSIKANMAV